MILVDIQGKAYYKITGSVRKSQIAKDYAVRLQFDSDFNSTSIFLSEDAARLLISEIEKTLPPEL